MIFNRNTKSWGSYFYDEKMDALRVDVKMKDIPHTEVLTYSFPDMDNNSATLALSWEKKQIPFRIEVDVHKVVLAGFREQLNGYPGFFWQGFPNSRELLFE